MKDNYLINKSHLIWTNLLRQNFLKIVALFFLAQSIFFSSAKAQPANNDCSGATTLIVNAAAVIGNVSGATQSIPSIVCNADIGTADDDVWYKFTTSAAG